MGIISEQIENLTGDNPFEEIYSWNYIDDLLDVIKNDGNVEEFIATKDTKKREDFIAKTTEKFKQSIDGYEKNIQSSSSKIQSLTDEKRLHNELQTQINDLASLYPEEKQKLLQDAIKNGYDSSTVQKLIEKPKGLFAKLKYGKQIEQANAKLEELMQFCQTNGIYEKASQSNLIRCAINGENSEQSLQEINKKIEKEQETLSYNQDSLKRVQGSIQANIAEYDGQEKQQYINRENDNIRQFVAQKASYIKSPPHISKEEIAKTGLNEDFIEGQIAQSKYAANIRSSVRRFYEGLDQPAAPMVAFAQGQSGSSLAQNEVIEKLKAMGINAVADTDEKAKDPTCFVVTSTSIQAPFMAPDEALKANIKMVEAICQSEHANHPFLSNPLTRDALAVASEPNSDMKLNMEYIAKNNGCNYEEITNGDIEGYLSASLKDAFNEGISPGDLDKENAEAFNSGQAFKSVFHGGKCSSPYAVLCNEDNMNFVYGAAGACGDMGYSEHKYNGWNPDGALGYSFGKSTHNNKTLSANGVKGYGFLFEYESRGDKQEFIGIDRAGATHFTGGKFDGDALRGSAGANDETTVLPHQNKLKKIYVTVKDYQNNVRILPLELDEKGQVKDKKWRDFIDIHKPVDNNLKGFMVERRNNMIADYDAGGKDKFMNRTLEEVNSKSLEYVKSDRVEVKVEPKKQTIEQPTIDVAQPQPQTEVKDTAPVETTISPAQDNTKNDVPMPPPMPPQSMTPPMPPPMPTQNMTPPMPPPMPTQSMTPPMPPPMPTQNMTPPMPPIPTQFQGMSNNQQYGFVVSLRHGTNPLLTPAKQTNSNTKSNVPINQVLMSQGARSY